MARPRWYRGWDLARGTVVIGAVYLGYLLTLALVLFVLAGVYSDWRLALAGAGPLLLAPLAGALLLGALRGRRGLLLLWLAAYGPVLLALTISVPALNIAATHGGQTAIRDFCESVPSGRCPWRMLRALLALFALEWFCWALVLFRYRQLGAPPAPAGDMMVRGAHDGRMYRVPVQQGGYEGLVETTGTPTHAGPPAAQTGQTPGQTPTHSGPIQTGPTQPADAGRVPPMLILLP